MHAKATKNRYRNKTNYDTKQQPLYKYMPKTTKEYINYCSN